MVKRYNVHDPQDIKLLARKLNLQRRQLTQNEKRDVVKAQLRETWHRADRWIAEDLGVTAKVVAARRKEIVDDSGDPRDHLPEKTLGRDGTEYAYAERKKPAAQSKSQSIEPFVLQGVWVLTVRTPPVVLSCLYRDGAMRQVNAGAGLLRIPTVSNAPG